MTPSRRGVCPHGISLLLQCGECGPRNTRLIDINAFLADEAAMLILSEVTWEHAGTAMPCSAEGGREGLLAALNAHRQKERDA